MESKMAKARRASGMTLEAASAVMGVSVPTYMDRESNPSKLTFRQFFSLAAEMDDDAKSLMSGVLEEVEASTTEWKPLLDLTLGEYFAALNCRDGLASELKQKEQSVFA